MAWPSARVKTAAAGGAWTASDMNDLQDSFIRPDGIVSADLNAGLAGAIGEGSGDWRGKTIVDTEQTTRSSTFATLSTPDAVRGVVVPSGGLLRICYRALWKCADSDFGYAAIFLNDTQLKVMSVSGAPQVTGARSPDGSSDYAWLLTAPVGLVSTNNGVASGGVTTGMTHGVYTSLSSRAGDSYLRFDLNNSAQKLYVPAATDGTVSAVVGGWCLVDVAAGTYDVSVRFRANGGASTVTAKERRLWVAVEDF